MDTAMRDMEQIQERDELDGPGRRIAMLAMAALSTVGLVFAMGILLGRSAEVQTSEEPDPLAALDDAVAIAQVGADEAADLAMRKPELIKAALDARIVDHATPLAGAKVVALFPPMTGG